MSTALPFNPSLFRSFVNTQPRIVLGSTSATRRAILNEIVQNHGLPAYEVAAANIDEKSIRDSNPHKLVVDLGYAKARALLSKEVAATWRQEQTYLITSDQVVVHNQLILEKPESADEVRLNIRQFAVTPAQTVGSVVCTHVPTGRQLHHIDVATVYMQPLPDTAIESLIEEGAVFHSAGGLLVEHPLVAPHVTRIEGGKDTIMGLSKNTVMVLLTRLWQSILAPGTDP